MAEPMCPSCGLKQMKTIPIPNAPKKASILFWISVSCLALSIISFFAILYHIGMAIVALLFYVAHRLIFQQADDIKLMKLRCDSCGWTDKT
jgi:hypothetical protein